MEKWFAPTQTSVLPAAEKVLVLAPHPDDEIFGCGGAIALYAQQQSSVHVHILTDGAGYAPQIERASIREMRRKESSAAVAQLGSGINCDFGPYQDRSLMKESNLVQHIRQLFQQHQPQLVIAPSPWEIHPDHQACSRAVNAAVSAWQRSKQSEIAIMFYEIGNPLRTNFLLDISNVWSLKAKAMQCFASQLKHQDYLKHVQGLNAYRTYSLPMSVEYAEAYHYLDAQSSFSIFNSGNYSINGPQGAIQDYLDHWTEAVLQSATTHIEDLQKEIFKYEKNHADMVQLQMKTLQLQEQVLNKEYLEKEEIRENLKIVQKQLLDTHQSTSWLITKPLRILNGFFRNLNGR